MIEDVIADYRESQLEFIAMEIELYDSTHKAFFTGIEEATDHRTLMSMSNDVNRLLPSSKAKKMIMKRINNKIKELLG